MTRLDPHDLDLAECSKLPRHEHGYRPPPAASPRCPQGHRQFRIKVGGPLPVSVFCTVCQQENRTATAYERGRVAGSRG
jgi:hypothetical protein